MDSEKIARLALVKQRVRDAKRSQLADAQAQLAVVDREIHAARVETERAHQALASGRELTMDELALRAQSVSESTANEQALGAARVARVAAVESARGERIDAERDVKMLEHAGERATASERAALDKRENAELDDRAAAQRSKT